MPAHNDRPVEDGGRGEARLAALRLAGIYAFVAALWIESSDRALAALGLPIGLERAISSGKGLVYVLVSAVGLYLLAVHHLRRLYASELRHRLLFENATEGLMMCRVGRDRGGRVADVIVDDANHAQSERLGMPREAIVGRRLSSETNERLASYLRVVESAARDGKPMRQELGAADGRLDELLSAFPIDPGLWVLACMDLTEIRAAQRALRHREEWIRDAYVDVLDAVTGGKLVLLTEEEIAGALGSRIAGPARIDSVTRLADARHAVSRSLAVAYPGLAGSMRLVNPFGEALNNALKHAGRGEYAVFVTPTTVQICVSDDGPGIDFRTLPKAALVAGFSTAATLGMGFTIMLQLCDRVLICTRPGRTVVVLELSAVSEDRGSGADVRRVRGKASSAGDAKDRPASDVQDVHPAGVVLTESGDR